MAPGSAFEPLLRRGDDVLLLDRAKAVAGEGATGNMEAARKVGQALAELARGKQIDSVVFNRNGFLFHGRVRALAEAAREAGLKF